MTISSLDLAIIQCLQRDTRMTNKAIAARVGASEQTVASRIRSMIDGKVMRVMAQRDLIAAGYPVHAFAGIDIGAAARDGVIAKLRDMPEIFSISICPGTPAIIANVNVRQVSELPMVAARIEAIEGITGCELTICEKVRKFVAGAGDLVTEIRPMLPAEPEEALDEVIIELLVDDGRLSNREIARRIGISESSVRSRLKRLTSQRIIRLGVVCEPDRVGFDHGAYIFFNGRATAIDAALEKLTPMEEISFTASATGAYDAIVMGVARNAHALPAICVDLLGQVDGVTDIVFRPLFKVAKHRFDYIHIGETIFEAQQIIEGAVGTAKRVTR